MLICLKNKLLYVAENWLQVTVDCYCPIRLVAVSLHPKSVSREQIGRLYGRSS